MSNASIRIEQLMLPTYPEPGKEEMPLFSEHRVHQRSTGRPYPNKVTLEVNRERKIERSYTVVHLENEYLDVLVLPEIGGRIFAARDKVTDYDFFYRQHVIKPGLIGALGSWISGGVEFNWPYHHRPSGFLPCDFETEECGDGSVICWLSEHDPIDRMKGTVGGHCLETRLCLSGNPREAVQPHPRDKELPVVGKRRSSRERKLPDLLPQRRHLCEFPLSGLPDLLPHCRGRHLQRHRYDHRPGHLLAQEHKGCHLLFCLCFPV